jgi:hypothetical protein
MMEMNLHWRHSFHLWRSYFLKLPASGRSLCSGRKKRDHDIVLEYNWEISEISQYEKGKCWGKKGPPGGLFPVWMERCCCLGCGSGNWRLVRRSIAQSTANCESSFLLLLAGPTHTHSLPFLSLLVLVSFVHQFKQWPSTKTWKPCAKSRPPAVARRNPRSHVIHFYLFNSIQLHKLLAR